MITILSLFENDLIDSLIQLLPVKILVGKVYLLSMPTNLTPIELGICFWYNFVCSLDETVLFPKHSVSAEILNGKGVILW